MQLKRNLRIWNKCRANRRLTAVLWERGTEEVEIFLLSCGTEQSGWCSVSVQPRLLFTATSGEVSLRSLHPAFCAEWGWLSWQIQRGKRWGICLFSLTSKFVDLKYNLAGSQLQPPIWSLSRARREKITRVLCEKSHVLLSPESFIHAKLHYPLKCVLCALPNALVSVFLFSYALLTCL